MGKKEKRDERVLCVVCGSDVPDKLRCPNCDQPTGFLTEEQLEKALTALQSLDQAEEDEDNEEDPVLS